MKNSVLIVTITALCCSLITSCATHNEVVPSSVGQSYEVLTYESIEDLKEDKQNVSANYHSLQDQKGENPNVAGLKNSDYIFELADLPDRIEMKEILVHQAYTAVIYTYHNPENEIMIELKDDIVNELMTTLSLVYYIESNEEYFKNKINAYGDKGQWLLFGENDVYLVCGYYNFDRESGLVVSKTYEFM